MKNIIQKTLILSLSLLPLTSCDTKDSDEVSEQSRVYGQYKVEASKGSNKVVGSATFYEFTSKWVDDHIALRSGSFVEFQANRMVEVRTVLDQTRYENNYVSTESTMQNQVVSFKYVNNDQEVFVNEIKLPPFVELNIASFETVYEDLFATIGFEWNLPANMKCKANACVDWKQSFYIKVKFKGTSSFTREFPVSRQRTRRKFRNPNNNSIDAVQLCSRITSKAKGASSKDQMTSIYCDQTYRL